jgi:peptide deformylase
MAIRKIVLKGEEILSKKCKPVKEVTKHIQILANDMLDTMIDADGVGLAAPQVGIMKRLFVCRPLLEDQDKLMVFINPEILEREGEQDSNEGCLSVPGYTGHVVRPEKVRIRALDINGDEVDETFEGFAATCICHEYDHLDGILYTDRATWVMTNEEYAEMLQEQGDLEDDYEEE